MLGYFLFFILTIVIMVFFISGGAATEFYKWIDKDGTIHFSDSTENVPSQYRDQVQKKRFDDPIGKISKSEEAIDVPEILEPETDVDEESSANRIEVPYIARDSSGASRIIIPVTFNQSVTAPMALDTGAPGMIISASLAEKLGVFTKHHGKLMVMTGGIGGTVPAIRTIIDHVQVDEAKGRFVPTTVTGSLSGSFEGLVGMDFISNYSLFIDTKKKVVVFEENLDASKWPGGHDEAWWRAMYREFSAHRRNWKRFGKDIDKMIKNTSLTLRSRLEQLENIKTTVDSQYDEAVRLFEKLNRYASQNAVPMEWREF